MTIEEIEEGDKILQQAVKDWKQGTGIFAKNQKEKEKKPLDKNTVTGSLRRYFDDDYLDKVTALAVENKWVKIMPIENDLLPFEEEMEENDE
jgi:hypothetical protein